MPLSSAESRWAFFKVLVFLILPLVGLELWARYGLFQTVSYTNSRNLDDQWRNFKSKQDWNIVAIGSSEVRWGLMPSLLDKKMAEQGVASRSFNLAMDGFTPGFYFALMPGMDLGTAAPNLKVLLIGVNMVEGQEIVEPGSFVPSNCTALQRPVLTSAFGIDHGFVRMCQRPYWLQHLTQPLEESIRFIRYRKSLRAFLLGQGRGEGFIPFQSNGLPHHPDGFQPHKSIEEDRANFEDSWRRFLASRDDHPEAFSPMDADIWLELVAEAGYFDRWLEYARTLGLEPVFFALPTNPLLIDTTNRRADYFRNSRLMSDWAEKRNVSFIDLGIQDSLGPERDFSDRRHLSVYGARKFSAALGQALGTDPRLIRAVSRP